jgi:hypothetical protein
MTNVERTIIAVTKAFDAASYSDGTMKNPARAQVAILPPSIERAVRELETWPQWVLERSGMAAVIAELHKRTP